MDDLEYNLKKKYGIENHFRVPDGYFENFSNDLMDKLPQRDPAVVVSMSLRPKRRVYLWAASIACLFVLGFVGVNSLSDKPVPQPSMSSMNSTLATGDTSVDEMADYVMMDNEDMYASLEDE